MLARFDREFPVRLVSKQVEVGGRSSPPPSGSSLLDALADRLNAVLVSREVSLVDAGWRLRVAMHSCDRGAVRGDRSRQAGTERGCGLLCVVFRVAVYVGGLIGHLRFRLSVGSEIL